TLKAIFFVDADLAIAMEFLLQQWVIGWVQFCQHHAVLWADLRTCHTR
ncbi:hypothetical protein D049_2498B, partial [Vibrio parahaemolyticus VPTS-2010]